MHRHTYILDLPGLFGFNMTDLDGYIWFGMLLCAIVILWQLWFRQNVKVNCWFCGYDNVVPRYTKLWWKCKICDQYNGFKKDGDYSKEIPGMFNESVTPPRFCAAQKNHVKTANLLCSPCARNQNQIVAGLADFSPSDDRYFDEELEIYKKELNSKFDLCLSCRTLVSYHLQQQNHQIQQTYNNNNQIVQRIEKGVRRLNVKLDNPRTCILGIYKFTHFLSLLAAIWLCRQMALNTRTDFVLINVSLIFTTGTFLTYLYMKKCDAVGCFVSIMWFLILLYGNFKTKDSRYLRKVVFSVLIFTEGIYLCNQFLVLIINMWKSMTYKQERKRKVDKIRDSPKVKPTESNVVVSRTVNEGSISKGLLSCTDTNSKSQTNNVRIRRPSTPDLLEGHLDAMFIQRKTETDYSPAKDTKNTNHVVAALKYSAPQLNHRVSGQVLKPATFSGQFSSPIFSGKLLRPATFISPYTNTSSSNNKNKDIHTFSKMTISGHEKQTPEKSIGKQDVTEDETQKEIEVEVVKSNKNQIQICTWTNIIIFVFVFSLICNIILAYKLSSVGR